MSILMDPDPEIYARHLILITFWWLFFINYLSFWLFLIVFIFWYYTAVWNMSGLWTEILTDFDPEEETANFGTRLSLVTEGSLYEVPSPLEFLCTCELYYVPFRFL